MAAPADRKYTSDHEWVKTEGDIATVGITSYAAAQLGDIVYVDLPEVGSTVSAGQTIGELESTKSVGELFCPVDGLVTEVNAEASASPEVVNSDPFGIGWLLKVQVTDLPELMDSADYEKLTGQA